ncbi:hypothetical protein MVEN_00468600 [Mycena venus]|uniref:Uncharacterized protein n=1 Tax=Mycena venus TaxID=2733690 RepID=A0A8H6YTA6_9AGAR|nr:hypothetical protein MVEN_00468600 [Mycena venus]
MVEYLLNTTTPSNAGARASVIQRQLRIMLTPYILYTARPSSSDIIGDDAWALPVWKGCATKHTAHIHASMALQSHMTPSERVLLRAVDETNREICRVVVRMWVAGVHAGLDALIPPNEHKTIVDPLAIVQGWRADIEALMKWLDWSVWVKCRPACGVEVLSSFVFALYLIMNVSAHHQALVTCPLPLLELRLLRSPDTKTFSVDTRRSYRLTACSMRFHFGAAAPSGSGYTSTKLYQNLLLPPGVCTP